MRLLSSNPKRDVVDRPNAVHREVGHACNRGRSGVVSTAGYCVTYISAKCVADPRLNAETLAGSIGRESAIGRDGGGAEQTPAAVKFVSAEPLLGC